MPHALLKLLPGVDTYKTPALNEAAVSFSNQIRFTPDRSGMGLIQKMGGWQRLFSNSFGGVIRSLKAWADLDANKYLAIGGEGTVGVQVYSPDDNSIVSVTPRAIIDDITPNGSSTGISTTSGSSSVTIYGNTIPTDASYVMFPTRVNIGDVNLFGPYDILTVSGSYYTISVPEVLNKIASTTASATGTSATITVRFYGDHFFKVGQSIFIAGVKDAGYNGTYTVATIPSSKELTVTKSGGTAITVTSSYDGTVNANVQYGGLTPSYAVTSGSKEVTVTFQNHGYVDGDTFNAPISTTVGGLTVYGLYTVSGATQDTFLIYADTSATSSTSGSENGGALRAYSFAAVTAATLPSGFVYGGGIYSTGAYGTGSTGSSASTGDAITAVDWSLDNWGSILMANPKDGAIYYWQPVGANISNLSYAPNSPVYNTGMFVAMPQRQVIAYGSSFGSIQDPLLVRWCDVEDFTVWIGTANNQAGSYRLPTGSKIVGGMQAAQQGLLWTDLDLWAMSYIGPPLVYGFNKIGANAGLIAQKAAGQMGGVVYWMSQKQFFKFSGQGVEPIPCPVWDQVFQNLFPGNDANGNPYTDRIRCAPNSQFNEITWYFPAHYVSSIDPATGLTFGLKTIGSGEVNAYVKYNVPMNQWDYGYQDPERGDVLIGRTAWVDQSILGPPIGSCTGTSIPDGTGSNYVYQHETSNNADGAAMPAGFTTGYATLEDGDKMIFVDQVWPDMKWSFVDEPPLAAVDITFFVTNYPGDPPIQYGPYTVTQNTEYLSVRMRGRYIAIGVSSTDLDSFWRLGAIRYRYQPDGKY